jgi:hypothetical protein
MEQTEVEVKRLAHQVPINFSCQEDLPKKEPTRVRLSKVILRDTLEKHTRLLI